MYTKGLNGLFGSIHEWEQKSDALFMILGEEIQLLPETAGIIEKGDCVT